MLPKLEGIVHQLCVEVAEVDVARTVAARAIVEMKRMMGVCNRWNGRNKKKEGMDDLFL
jgi:hypothetical protein